MRFFFLKKIRINSNCNGKNSLAGHFFLKKIQTSFFLQRITHVQSFFLPEFALLFLLVSTMLGLRAWSDDLNVVLFEFLDDDTMLVQSCTDWLYVQHWHTVVPDLAMRVTLWALMAMIVTSALKTHRLSIFPFSRVVLMSATIASVQADSAVPGVLFPRSCPYLCCASCSCITRRPLSQGQACVDAVRRLAL